MIQGLTVVNNIAKWISQSTKPVLIQNRHISIYLDKTDIATSKAEFDELDLDSVVFEGEITLNLSKAYHNTKIYLNIEDFLNLFTKEYFESNIGILDYNSQPFYFNISNGEVCINGENEIDFLILNSVAYLKFREYIESDKFADYFNSQNNEVVIYTSEKGVKKIKIPRQIVLFNIKEDISGLIEEIIPRLDNLDFKNHFKNVLYSIEKGASSGFDKLFINIQSLYDEAVNNYNIWSKKFSFDNLFSELRQKKDKYFSSLHDILSKLLGQITSVPIAISASVFATYKVNDPLVLILISIAFSTYILFTLYILGIFNNDIKYIDSDFKKDFLRIKEESGLNVVDIEREESKITRKIRVIANVIKILSGVFILLLGVFLYFVFYMMGVSVYADLLVLSVYIIIAFNIYMNKFIQ